MRLPHPTPTPDPLPFDHFYSGNGDTPRSDAVPLPPPAVARFDTLLHEINADAPRVDGDRVQQLMAWLLHLDADRAHGVIDSRMGRVQELRAMVEDPAWDSDYAMRKRVAKLLDYIDRDDDLIADRVPLLGRLDDVLLIELAWPAFADEVDDFRDFCSYRQMAHPSGGASEQREQWVRDRLHELALMQHHHAVREQHYAPHGQTSSLFRVG
ncbi:hypothetical protein [Lysobacter niastensis]|uniref:DUF1232 domain-containing protein n=1 Tax=Lysobacter niastensis TaxID=380629 RepID=A0ABS0B7C7_9GAMM|nr:hypothetical protein [Lysobacter niastensis]MBF6022904.1 hypothetical protein [Lysobacter niastensis]